MSSLQLPAEFVTEAVTADGGGGEAGGGREFEQRTEQEMDRERRRRLLDITCKLDRQPHRTGEQNRKRSERQREERKRVICVIKDSPQVRC